MKFGLVLHPSRPSALDTARSIVENALSRGMHIMAREGDLDRLPGASPWDTATESADAIIAVGGDGTMLEAAHIGRVSGAPIVGVNVGTVGFLTEIDPGRVSEMLDRLATGRYTVSERLTLRARLGDETAMALNDVVTEKAVSQHIVGIGVSIDDEPFTEYRADAVIVATPTGSTAYTFSAGGPLVDPDVEAIVVTPVAPHNLFGRPMVLSGSAVVDLTIVGDRSARVHADGRTLGTLEPGEAVRVQAGPDRDRIIHMDPPSFSRTVTEKFRTRNAR